MTRDQLTTLLPVMIAWKEGKSIQKRHISGVGGSMEWHDVVGEDPYFGCEHTEWRVKPEPREWWFCPRCKEECKPHQAWCYCPGINLTVSLPFKVVHVREVLP